MPATPIHASISPTDLQAIKEAIALIRAKMPFLVALSPDERRNLFKMGDKSLAFVQDALMVAQNNPNILPASFAAPEMAVDVALASQLSEVDILLQQLASEVDDTLLATGSEAMSHGLEVYSYVKVAAKTQPGLRPVENQLGDRFKRSKAKTPAPPTP